MQRAHGLGSFPDRPKYKINLPVADRALKGENRPVPIYGPIDRCIPSTRYRFTNNRFIFLSFLPIKGGHACFRAKGVAQEPENVALGIIDFK